MGDIWQQDKLFLFLAFFLPGFISTEIYGLFIAVGERDFVKQLPAIVAYSAIHYAFTLPIYILAPAGPWKTFAAYLVVLVLPLAWPPIVLLMRDWHKWAPRILSKEVFTYMLQPEYSPWDRVFDDLSERWIRIRLKSGAYVGGLLAKGSLTSTYPCPEQIFVQEEWTLDSDTGAFQHEVPSAGLLVNGAEIEFIELIEGQESAGS
ncbi:MAG TPA: DUF6338 family protein [Candidatus Limnocylindrales bacterium]|nr:DUF6338 family protein [Candidatus Limnocylindrales bacterium]